MVEEHMATGGEALPDTVILDLNMPKVTGHGVLMTAKDEPKCKDFAVVGLSTSDNPADVKFCQTPDVKAVYKKPDSYDALPRIMKNLVDALPLKRDACASEQVLLLCQKIKHPKNRYQP